MLIEIRPCREEDADALLKLNQDVQSLHAELEPGYFKTRTDPDAVKAFFAGCLSEPAHSILMAFAGGRASGYVWYERQTRPETFFAHPRRRIYIHHLSVAPDMRRAGIASALMRHVEETAAREAISAIVLDTLVANDTARDFYAAQGFVPRLVNLKKAVTPPQSAS